MIQQLREIPLAQDLIHAHSHAVGKVQAAAGIPHGHPDAVLLVGRQQCLGQAGILPPEHEIGPVRVLDVGVALGRFGGKVVERAFVPGKEILQPIIVIDVEVVPVIQPGMLELFVIDGKPMGPTRCRRQAVQAQVRATLPVFWGIRGSTRTMFRVGFSLMAASSVIPAHRAEPGQQGLEPDTVPGVLIGGGLLNGQRDELGGVVGSGAQGVALDQRANEHGTVQVTRAREAAADVQFLMTKRSRPEPAQPMYLPSARPVTTALGASVSSSSASA